MLGMIFTELLEMVEAKFSPELADRVLLRAELPNGGAYTAVGYYPHAELVRIVAALVGETGLDEDRLIGIFGEHLLGRFALGYPEFFAGKPTLHDFLASIDGHIHLEVHKLYPQAQLPRFEVIERSQNRLRLAYRSARQMTALAEGLIRGAVSHYGEHHTIAQVPIELDGTRVTCFDIQRVA